MSGDPHRQAARPRAGRPSSNSRRRFLVAAGYGATNVAILRAIGSSADADTQPEPVTDRVVELTTEVDSVPVLEGATLPEPGQVFDVVIANGRVIDPESGYDAVADVGIVGSTVAAIGSDLTGTERIDATGQVVAPGFIDILSAEPNNVGVWFKVADGVTTNMAMHGVNNYANAFFRRYEGKTPVHFGGAWHQHFIRGEDQEVGAVLPNQALTSAQVQTFAELTDLNLANGLAGVSFSPEYSPATTTEEIDALTKIAVARGHSVFFHVRYSDPVEPDTSIEALEEVLGVARRTGASCHVEHLSSTGGTFVMEEALQLLRTARDEEGLDITADVYPYDFWGTTLASYRFAGDWQTRYRISFDDLQVAGTVNRLTEETFREAFEKNLLVAALGSIPEADVQLALQEPWIMIGSDAILTDSVNHHPRGAGTFSRTLGRYVRELGVLSLPDALAKMTILPAKRLQGMIPALAAKGRLQIGADADVVVFDPATVSDQATVAVPNALSTGFSQVLVAGQRVMADGELQRTVLPGQPLRAS